MSPVAARALTQALEAAHPSRCPLCAPATPEAETLLSEGDYRLVCCEGCGLTRLTPSIPDPDLAAILSQETYNGYGELDWRKSYPRPALEATRAFRNARANHARLADLARRFGPKPAAAGLRVHDIGCSEGFSLLLGREAGFVMSGNDLSPLRRDFARRELGVEIALGRFEALGPPLEVVALRHVLEHLTDPLAELGAIHRRLVEGGLLVVEVPNFGAPSLRLKTWRQAAGLRRGSLGFLGVPEHQWQFTAGTLARLLSKAGFEVAHAGTSSRATNHWAPVRALLQGTLHRVGWGSYLSLAARRRGPA